MNAKILDPCCESINSLERHDYACCCIDEVYHITNSAFDTLCGKKWLYKPSQEWLTRAPVQQLRFLAEHEITCEECLRIAKQKEANGENFYK